MSDLQMDTTKYAALRLCAEVVEERDALRNVLRDIIDPKPFGEPGHRDLTEALVDARALLARLDGRTG